MKMSPSLHKIRRPHLSRRKTVILLSALAVVIVLSVSELLTRGQAMTDTTRVFVNGGRGIMLTVAAAQVMPKDGFRTKIILGDVVPKMVAAGIIDTAKVSALYQKTGGMPNDELKLLAEPSQMPLTVTNKNAAWLVNILWPLGLANHLSVNDQSPIAGQGVSSFASTGGWTLGKAADGGSYFSKYPLIILTPQQEERVKRIAENTYRPCCSNSSFYQDCNHGSAAMALIELGVAQGLSDKDIYRTVLAFNSYWFPLTYTQDAVYLMTVKHTLWASADPELLLSKTFSSLDGATKVAAEIVPWLPDELRPHGSVPVTGSIGCGAGSSSSCGGGSCGVQISCSGCGACSGCTAA